MGFNEWTEHSRQQIRIERLSSGAQTISTTPIKISGILVSEQGGSAEILRFTLDSAGTEHFSLNIGANETKFFPIHAEFASLETLLDSTGDVDVTVFAASASRGTAVTVADLVFEFQTVMVDFDGVGEYMLNSTNTALGFGDAFTINTWLKFTADPATSEFLYMFIKADISSPDRMELTNTTAGDVPRFTFLGF